MAKCFVYSTWNNARTRVTALVASNVLMLVVSNIVVAQQSVAQMEYMFASSPLKSGGRVVSRTSPGQGVVTYIERTIAANNPSQASVASSSNSPAASQGNSVLENQSSLGQQPTRSDNAQNNPSNVSDNIYPYPIATAPTTAPNFPSSNPITKPKRLFGCLSSRPSCCALINRWRNSTWSMFPSNGLCTCFNAPVTEIEPPPASIPPAIGLNTGQLPPPDLSWAPQSYIDSTALAGQIATGEPHNGYGLFGSSETYIDGQPIRNLFRFLSPF